MPDLYRITLAPYVDPSPVQDLLLGNNPRLSFLPVWTSQCTALTRLSLRYTSVTLLPYYLGWLTTLTDIDFAGCDVSRPDVIIQQRGTLAMMQYMRQMDSALWTRELDLSGQDFSYIPLEVCFFSDPFPLSPTSECCFHRVFAGMRSDHAHESGLE